jgi:hypothetical protein
MCAVTHIDECDLSLLFWSSAAKASEWVLKEAGYALNRQKGDPNAPPDIHPVIIEGPPVPEPPPELRHLLFNDPLIYFMKPAARGSSRLAAAPDAPRQGSELLRRRLSSTPSTARGTSNPHRRLRK